MNNLREKCVLEKSIIDLVYTDNRSICHFEYNRRNVEEIQLTVITSSNSHEELFILYTTKYLSTEIECLRDAYNYLVKIRDKNGDYLTYKIEWSKKDGKKVISHFYGRTLNEVIDKFYKNKMEVEYIIWSINLMPQT